MNVANFCHLLLHNSIQYDPSRGMACQNRGPWHLGITSRACENAGGRWFRSPCVTLKECIDSRPSVDDAHYSPSFEFFALEIVILDPTDEKSCQEAREGLGHEPDYPFDTEVCDSFNEMMCDPLFFNADVFNEPLGGTNDGTSGVYQPPE